MRFVVALAVMICLASAAAAGGSSAKKKAPAHGKPESEAGRDLGAPSEPNIDMPGLVAPVVVDGELHHYIYFSLNLKLTDASQRSAVLEKIPYIQDAFLREVHAASIAYNNDPAVVDQAGVISRLQHVCDTVAGPGVIKRIEIMKAVQSGF